MGNEELREVLRERAFLFARDGVTLRNRRGGRMPWMFYGGEVNLSFEGVTLMAGAVLERLETFSSTQLATYGLSAIPIVTACVTAGAGRYTGLVVRKEPKPHGQGRRIDGPLDRARSAVVVDESISSGTSALNAILALEAAGVAVEGVVCVVGFGGYGGADWLAARGYRVETVFDVWRDLGLPPTTAAATEPRPVWSETPLPDGLSPASAARQAVAALLRDGRLPLPPRRLDREYLAEGGTVVSIRRRDNDARVARGGVRREEGEAADPARDVVLAAHGAAAAPRSSLADLGGLKFAVSFLDAPEPIRAGQIDPAHHGLLVRGVGPLDRIGAALPNAPHYDDEVEQYLYARRVTARFGPNEPHRLYRQRVERIVQPGAGWPPYGAPQREPDWTRDAGWGERLAARIGSLGGLATGAGAAAALPQPPEPLHGAAVSIFAGGLSGCAVRWGADLDLALREASAAAFADRRWGERRRPGDPAPPVVVSLLLRHRSLGQVGPERLELFHRLGRDTLCASDGSRLGVVLAHFATIQAIDRAAYQRQVLAKGGLDGERARWDAYETVSWLVADGRGQRLELGLPVPDRSAGPDRWRRLTEEIAAFVVRLRRADGLPAYGLDLWSGEVTEAGTATRVLIALTGLLEARPWIAPDLGDAAVQMVGSLLGGGRVLPPRGNLRWDAGSDAQILTCISSLEDRERHRPLALALASRLRSLFHEDGAVHAGNRGAADLDYLSGSVLCALAAAAEWLGPEPLAGLDLERVLTFHRRRFELAHPWGMTWWHARAWSALADRVAGAEDFAFALVDWALERQSESSGAFVIADLEPARTSFLSACVLEGVAAAWGLARRRGDRARAERCRRAWEAGADFLARLTLGDGDAYFSRNPAAGAGGVRPTLASAELRVDYAGHALLALAKGLRER